MARTHVLLDLDGTLSASAPGITRTLREALITEGFDAPNEEELLAFVGPPFEQVLPSLGVPSDRVWAVIDRYRDRYDRIGLFETSEYDGITGMLDALRAAEIALAVATSKPEATAVRIVEHFGWSDRFDVVAGATFDADRRTKAAVIEHALAALDTTAGDHVVMVGDREHDVRGALAHGIDCIGVGWGYAPAGELEAAGAIAVADTPADVVDLIIGARR
ncbi:MAG: HAD-IA family hydrolase [Desertimonas sp.]